MKKRLLYFMFIVFVILMAISCLPTSDDEVLMDEGDGQFEGTIQDVEDIYSPETVQAIQELGFVINEGNSPPSLEGVYIVDPLVFEETNIQDDLPFSTVFLNVRFAISNQDNTNLTLDFTGYTGATKYEVIESFISGEGSLFTIYLKTLSTDLTNGSEGVFAYTFSGRKTEDGLENLSWTLMMLDDSRDFSNIFIDNNQGRKFSDGDGLSKLLCPIENGSFDGSLNSLFQIFPQDAIQEIRTLGMRINEGNSPPSLLGVYSFDPLLEATTRLGLDDNLIFEDMSDLTFLNQEDEVLEIDFDGIEDDTPNGNFDWLQGVKSYISGSGNRFTIFSKVFEYDTDLSYQPLSLYIFSGTVSVDGKSIHDFTYGLYMIDDGGDGTSFYIENGDARYFINDTSESKGKSIGNNLNNKNGKSRLPIILSMEKKNLNNLTKE